MDPFAGYGDDQDSSSSQSNKVKKAKSPTSTSALNSGITDLSQDNSGGSIPHITTKGSSKDGAKVARAAKKEAKTRQARPLTWR